MQHAISAEALQYLESQTDAKGRRLEVIKMPLPPPLHISEEESAGVAKVDGSAPREVRPAACASCLPNHLQMVAHSGRIWLKPSRSGGASLQAM